ncbi:MAG: restriction endonuclease [Butyrivibrio sp.]|nr:restriction endonuclease [Butyrivibrio sp.]
MIINDKKNFLDIIAKVLHGLGYSNVKKQENGKDITADKDHVKYIFRCKYDIDAIGAKYIEEFAGNVNGYDKMVYVTNSSFIPAAKNSAESNNIELWDRNVVDRLSIAMHEDIVDEIVEKKKFPVVPVVIAIVLTVAIAFVLWKFVL